MESGKPVIAIVDVAMKHSHMLIVSLYLLQLLIRVILMVAAKPETVNKYTKAMRIPHIVLSVLMLGTGIWLMARSPVGVEPYLWIKLALIAASIPLGVMGTKRGSVAFTGLSLALLLGAMGLSFAKPAALRSTPSSELDSTKPGADSPSVKAGKVIFEQKCVLCHGVDGKAGVQGAKDLSVSALDDAAIVDIIKHGKGVMPATDDLTDEQVQQVKDYVKYLRN